MSVKAKAYGVRPNTELFHVKYEWFGAQGTLCNECFEWSSTKHVYFHPIPNTEDAMCDNCGALNELGAEVDTLEAEYAHQDARMRQGQQRNGHYAVLR